MRVECKIVKQKNKQKFTARLLYMKVITLPIILALRKRLKTRGFQHTNPVH